MHSQLIDVAPIPLSLQHFGMHGGQEMDTLDALHQRKLRRLARQRIDDFSGLKHAFNVERPLFGWELFNQKRAQRADIIN